MRIRGIVQGTLGVAILWLLLLGLDRALVYRLAASAVTVETETHEPEGIAVRRRTPVPIPAEALVFRTTPAAVANDAHAPRHENAHPRTLATFRRLRAYPGAPPRVPHGLTAEEFRTTTCNTCHERGGWSSRFAAYVPLTPHPEWASCLQCHATDAPLMGSAMPVAGADAVCAQCHAPAGARVVLPAIDWRPAAWPGVRSRARDGTPPEIPHDLQLRGNCLACHMGPSAVAEIRTTHPERANCRQCHLAADEFSLSTAVSAAEGWLP
jgi:nitrate reductase (cytochrome), electron transfer subunit